MYESTKYVNSYLNVLPVILMVLYFCVVYQYAYAVYRLHVLLIIWALIIWATEVILLAKGIVDKESLFMGFLGVVNLILCIVSYTLLYKTAKKYNM